MFEVPVLFIIFNRPDTTQRTFDVIGKIRPKVLFVAADGPRPGVPEDREKCINARMVVEQVDWECKLYTLFREENRGCGHGPAEAITWFFEHVEEGIVLEDDCLADLSFFPYCKILLELYRHEKEVFMITGTNALGKWGTNNRSYLFSYMGNSLGWATWRRAWQTFDYDMKEWATEQGKQKIRATLSNKKYFDHFSKEFTKYQSNLPDDVWDFQWLLARWLHGGKTIVPSVNLIKNIGFNMDATHSINENDLMANLPLYTIDTPLLAAKKPLNKFFDWYLFERFINSEDRPFWKKVLLKIIKTVTGSN